MAGKQKKGEGVVRLNITLTPTALNNLDRISEGMQISRSELLDRMGRLQMGTTEVAQMRKILGEA
jgi:metal-responsive CopG/Arc/MetJ family transcriptional regulator